MGRRKEAEDSIWLQYFKSIKDVCPWSYESYINGKIKILPYNEESLELTEANWTEQPLDALVYVVEGLTLDEIDDIVADRNDCQEKCEYLHFFETVGRARTI